MAPVREMFRVLQHSFRRVFGPSGAPMSVARQRLSEAFLLAALMIGLSTPLTSQVIINEALAVNAATILDEELQSSDWVELVNRGSTPVNLAGYGLSDDVREPMKWEFPPLELSPQEYLVVWCSGEDRVLPISPAAVVEGRVPFVPTLVTREAEWSYLVGDAGAENLELPAGWTDLEFDDAGWPTGQPGFGFGDDDDTTVLPENIGAVLLRHRFRLSGDDLATGTLFLQADFDDGFVAYLNGVEILRVNVDEGALDFASKASRGHEAGEPERFALGEWLSLLQQGDNILAMVLLNLRVDNNDLSLIPELGESAFVAHTNFRLSSSGETVVLTAPDGTPASSLTLPSPQVRDRSYGRTSPSAESGMYFLQPTPGAPNDSLASTTPIASEPLIEPAGGRQTAAVTVSVSAEGFPFDQVEVRYTLDGSVPTAESPLYTAPFVVDGDASVRAAVFRAAERISEVATRGYFFTADRFALPIFSIAMAPERFEAVHASGAGETPIHLEILAPSGEIVASTGAGMRLHGGAGRGGDLNIKKSYRLNFRSRHGDGVLQAPVVLDTPVDEFDKLVLRANFNDAFRNGPRASLIRDQVIRDVHGEMGGVYSHGGWFSLLVNMEYRGIYNVVERMDRKFLASYFPGEGENWYVMKTGETPLDGGNEAVDAWREMKEFFETSDFTDDASLEAADRVIDLHDYTRYMIVNIWAQNQDWPQNNWYAARPSRFDGRWIFMCWDAEWGLGYNPQGWSSDTLEHVFEREGAPVAIPLVALMDNSSYQRFFFAEVERYLEGPLRAENVLAHISRAGDFVALDIAHETTLPGPSGDFDVATWEASLAEVEEFAIERGARFRNIMAASQAFTFARVTNARPEEISPEGPGFEVLLAGRNLSVETRILFNELLSPRVELDNSRRMRAVLPYDLRVEGEPEITVEDPVSGVYAARGLLRVTFPRPQPTSLTPAHGTPEGGDRIVISGSGFVSGARVEFGGVAAASVDVIDGSTLSVVTPPGSGVVDVRVVNTRPGELPGEMTLDYTYTPASGGFRRGDGNVDGAINITDAIATLRFLFASLANLPCEDALDADDSGRVEVSDAIHVLNYLFRAGSPPPEPPIDNCGDDPTPDALRCDLGVSCF